MGMNKASSLLEELRQRELLAQVSDAAGLDEHLESGSRTLYCGFDPTADSLHIGNLVPLITLRRFQRRGHRPLLLIGGATGMIGDPSGRSAERNLNSADVVGAWVERIRGQVEGLLAFDGGEGGDNNPAVIVNNLDWTAGLQVIDFLRDVGKHFSVNQMIQRDSVRSRLEREGEGISYTEFSYMLLQANDFAELAERYGCSIQIGGSDQWGNIVSGIDLVRRKLARESYALTVPLITKADGSKFGKTAQGTVWLDAARTSPYRFYQFWLNTADADAVRFLKIFTFLDLDEVARLDAEMAEVPEQRVAQRRLAQEVTGMVHGSEALASAERITAALFDGDLASLSGADLEQLAQDGMDCMDVSSDHIGLLAALTDAGLTRSRGEARKLVAGKGIRVNGQVQSDVERELDWQDALHGRYYLLRKGKKHWHMLRRTR
jgi:tyrosyl-tRNA synthetase